jgi:hypothetical protein
MNSKVFNKIIKEKNGIMEWDFDNNEFKFIIEMTNQHNINTIGGHSFLYFENKNDYIYLGTTPHYIKGFLMET